MPGRSIISAHKRRNKLLSNPIDRIADDLLKSLNICDSEAANKRTTLRKRVRCAHIKKLKKVRFAPNTKLHDGVLPELKEAARVIYRILGQTNELGQGYINSCQDMTGNWIPNPYSWAPQKAWDTVPDALKRKTASILIDFFRRWTDAISENLTKVYVIQWGEVIQMEGGCDIALQLNNMIHRSWIDKIRMSITMQSLQRVAYLQRYSPMA
jgi:hypothetical protein